MTITECSFTIDLVIALRTKDLDKQQRIKEALVQLILREGMQGASISKIAREARVSPATIYVYYESKDEMLSDVFQEYARQSYRYLMRRVRPDMDGAQFIDALVRGYYAYSVEHEEVFSFVEQCSRCPTLSDTVDQRACCCEILDLIHQYQDRGQVRRYSDVSLAAVLFSPVRSLAMKQGGADRDVQLAELVQMLQDTLLI